MSGEVGVLQKDEIKVMSMGRTIKLEMELHGQELERVKEFVYRSRFNSNTDCKITQRDQNLDSKSNQRLRIRPYLKPQ